MDKQNNTRISKQQYYLNIAEEVMRRGTCLKNNYGAVIINKDEIISTGYTGAPRGRKNCCDIGICRRNINNMPSGQGYEKCRSVHAEQNAIISASRKDMIGATLYLCGINHRNGEYKQNAEPCSVCKRMIINAGIKKVVIRRTEEDFVEVDVDSWIEDDDTIDFEVEREEE